MADGGFAFCDGEDPGEQFNRNEAISAVADEGFLGDDDDDDYEDLYNDVNVGEGFLQSLSKNEELLFKIDDKKVESSTTPVQDPAEGSYSIPVAPVDDSGEGVEDMKLEDAGGADCLPKIPKKIDEFPDDEFKVKELSAKGSISGNTMVEGVPASGGGIRVELVQSSSKLSDFDGKIFGDHRLPQQIHGSPVMNTVSDGILKHPGVSNMNSVEGMGNGGSGGGGSGGGGGTILFVGDLHWWTTDAELEGELCKYGSVKEVKFFDEKASGKSKGYCQVEFYESSAAISCKERMNGYAFNGRPCVVAFASPFSVKRMGEAQVNKSQQIAHSAFAQARRPVESIGKSGGGNMPSGVNYQSGDGGRYGRGSWGRGNLQGTASRNQIGPMRNRTGNMGGRGIMGNGANGFGQGISAASSILHSQAMIGQGFDPTIGGTMGRMGNYGGFPAVPTPPFSGILSSFPSVGGVGLPGVAPHVNPAFFGRGMTMGGMGMMPTSGVEGSNMGMWSDPNLMGWAGEDHGGRAGESSYGEEAVSEHQYREGSHERGAWMNTGKEKDRASERDWSASSERWHRDERELGYDRDQPREKDQAPDSEWADRRHRSDKDISRDRDRERDRDHGRSRDRDRDRDRDRERDRDRDRERDRPRDDRDKYSDHHRHRDREIDNDDDRERGRSSRTHSKSRLSQEDEQRSRSRDADFGKRRRVTSE